MLAPTSWFILVSTDILHPEKDHLHHLMNENQTAIMPLNPLTTLKTLVTEVLVLCVLILISFL